MSASANVWGTEEISARTFHSLALHIIQQGSKKIRRSASWRTTAPHGKNFSPELAAAVPGEKKAQAKGWRLWLEEEMDWQIPEGILAG